MRCSNCHALVRGDDGVCEVCGATLPAAAIPAQKPGGRFSLRRSFPPKSKNESDTGRRPSTLGQLFGTGSPFKQKNRQPLPTDSASLPRYGPSAAPRTPRANADWGAAAPPEDEPSMPRPRYRRDTAGVVGSLRSALEFLPDVQPTGRGKHRRNDSGSRRPGWLPGRGRDRQPEPDLDDLPGADQWEPPPATESGHGPQGWNAPAAPPARGGWDAPSAPPRAAPDGWGPSAPPPAPGGWGAHAPMRGQPIPLDDAWQQAVSKGPPTPRGGMPYPGELADRHNTGRGWSIVMPVSSQASSQSYLAVGPVRLDTPGARLTAALRHVTHFSFNMILLAIILTILAIPTAIGVVRFGLLNQPAANTKPTPTPRPIPTAYPGYRTLRTTLYTIAYPLAWHHTVQDQAQRAGYALQEHDFATTNHVSLAIATSQTVPQDRLVPLLDSIAVSLSDPYQAANFQILSPTQPGPTLDGQQWLSNGFTFDLSDGKTTVVIQGEALATNYGVGTYVMVFLAPQAQFGDVQNRYLRPMLASFRFRK